jgi:hypothetical protein
VLYVQAPLRHLFSSSLLVAMEDVALLAWQQLFKWEVTALSVVLLFRVECKLLFEILAHIYFQVVSLRIKSFCAD